MLHPDGPLRCTLERVEVMGRDVSVVSTHPAFTGQTVRSIIASENSVAPDDGVVRFAVKPRKLFLFDPESGARIPFEAR